MHFNIRETRKDTNQSSSLVTSALCVGRCALRDTSVLHHQCLLAITLTSNTDSLLGPWVHLLMKKELHFWSQS